MNEYKIEYLHEGHSKCCVFILHTNPDSFSWNCEYVNINKIKPFSGGIKEYEDSYYEAILEYGIKIVEDPVLPIRVKVVDNGYELCGDGVHRMAALRRTNIEKVRVAIFK